MYRIDITPSAEADIEQNFDWWSTNRSAEQANRWYFNIFNAIETLREFPDRCPLAPESEIFERKLRELHFGIGIHPTHRILFTISGDLVSILRVRHAAQDKLSTDDV